MIRKVATDKDAYLQKLLKAIDTAKEQHRNGVFWINDKVSDNVAKATRDYLTANTKYRIDFRKCNGCQQSTWDIMVIF